MFTYRELAACVSQLSFSLRHEFDLRTGERVALAMKNCPEYYVVLFACWHAGLTPVPMNAKLHPKEFSYILENSEAKLCFVSADLESSVPSPISIASSEYRDLFDQEESRPADVRPDDVAWLFYTSGTTGVPKGAALKIGRASCRERV